MLLGPGDSRLEFANKMLKLAIAVKRQGQNELALMYLGEGLHAKQDFYAHIGPPLEHLKKNNRWDDPTWRPDRYSVAEQATKRYLEQYVRATK